MKFIKRILLPVYEFVNVYFLGEKPNFSINKKNNIYMFLSPDYGNIGDIAINYAQKKFLQANLKGFKLIEIPISKTYKYMKYVKRYINDNDIITLVGGGNLCDYYPNADYMRLYIIKTFKNNKIISFPQTFHFSNTRYGELRRNKNLNCFKNAKNLTLALREEESFSLVKKSSKEINAILCPDMVLSLNVQESFNRRGIIIALRNDNERKISIKTSDILEKICINNNVSYKKMDTVIYSNFDVSKKEVYLQNILKSFCSSKLVITDRLHGMIFCFITGTPCLVFCNNNHKILSTYKTWLSDCNFIYLVDDNNEINIEDKIKTLLKIQHVEKPNLNSNFKILIDAFSKK